MFYMKRYKYKLLIDNDTYGHVLETLAHGSSFSVFEQNLCHSSFTVHSPLDSAGNSKDSPQLKQTSLFLIATDEFCLSVFFHATNHTTSAA